jgi:A/G-specific adenine glycosylase
MTVAKRKPRKKLAISHATRPQQLVSAASLLAWYDRNKRKLPWRAENGVKPDPYSVWLSEIMLQQTNVKTVAPYYARFLTRWPRVTDLAQERLEEVLKLWAGLGYYARARNLHACARTILENHAGRFPDTEAELRTLPGIGAYTAAAIAAIAFGRKATPVDGNIERVMARLHAEETPLPAAKPILKSLAARHVGTEPRALQSPLRQAGRGSAMQRRADVCRLSRPQREYASLLRYPHVDRHAHRRDAAA